MKIKGFDEDVQVLWTDKKRYFGLPISFTRYAVVRKPGLWTKIVCIKGWISTDIEEVHAYRVDDLNCKQSIINRVFGVGNIDIYCKDASCDILNIVQVKNPMKVKSLINDIVEEERALKGMRYAEMSASYEK